MDILRKELDAIYAGQHLDRETLDAGILATALSKAKAYSEVNNGCCVITDASADRCYIMGGSFCRLLGLSDTDNLYDEADSSDEDAIYIRLHPEDLADKRMLEYDFFMYVDPLPGEEKLKYKATCKIRVRNNDGEYMAVSNSTQVIQSSPGGKIWLILCCYDLAPDQQQCDGISPRIVNNSTGEIISIPADERRKNVLTQREKEILRLIQQGKPSKQIASQLNISIHTVNRHRQNIIGKLSVGNTIEAIMAATMMRLL